MTATGIMAVLGGLLLAAFLDLFLKSRKVARLERELKELKVGFDALREAAKRREYRIERYDALWYATVAEGEKGLEAAPGLPHCKACAVPLAASAGKGDWACPKCGARLPASLAELHVTDSIRQLALSYYKERRKP